MQTFGDVQFGLKEKQFGLLVHLLDICATFQASSADCERGFSLKMNFIKTKTRNWLQTDDLDMLMRIKHYQASRAQTDLEKVYCQWSSQKDRCEKLLLQETDFESLCVGYIIY